MYCVPDGCRFRLSDIDLIPRRRGPTSESQIFISSLRRKSGESIAACERWPRSAKRRGGDRPCPLLARSGIRCLRVIRPLWNRKRTSVSAASMSQNDPKRKSFTCSTGAPFVFAYRRVKTPNKNPNPKAIASRGGLRLNRVVRLSRGSLDFRG